MQSGHANPTSLELKQIWPTASAPWRFLKPIRRFITYRTWCMDEVTVFVKRSHMDLEFGVHSENPKFLQPQ
jgi:hypothetical protein